MKNHPISDVWPMMDEAKIAELADDIRKNGQLVPVWLYEGKILDGRNCPLLVCASFEDAPVASVRSVAQLRSRAHACARSKIHFS